MMGDLLRVAEAAEMLSVTPATVTRWLTEGKIKGVLLPSGRWRVPQSEIDRILMVGSGGE